MWFSFKNLEIILFSFCYITPSDLPNFSSASFASIQERLCTCQGKDGSVLIVDINARFGKSIGNLFTHMIVPNREILSYPTLPDNINAAIVMRNFHLPCVLKITCW